MIEYEILCDDGEVVVIEASNPFSAMWDAIERGYKAVSVEQVDD